jgi:hypothetical protein
MPKSKPLFSSTLPKYVNEFAANIFSTDGTILYCKIYEVRVSAEKKIYDTTTRRKVSNKHIIGVKKKKDKEMSCLQTLITTSSNSSFNSDLCKAFLCTNITLNKLSQPTFRKFLEKYTNKSISDQEYEEKHMYTNVKKTLDMKSERMRQIKKFGFQLTRQQIQ